MDKIYCQLSKLGDVIGILGIAHAAHLRGEKVGIMVAKEYSNILDGVSYAEKIVFDGHPWELEKAVEQAKKLCPNVVVTMVNGPVDAIKKFAYAPAGQDGSVTDSFARESWKLAGCLKEWGKASLIFDQRDKAREDALMPKGWFARGKKKKILLVAASNSKNSSSPFPYRNLLLKLLRLNYANFNIIDLADIKAERFYDLLGLFEAAHCLVTVDTAHLHLAAAVPILPVMALIQDRPLYWHGSAWRPQHHFFCRYRDFPWRALEMFDAIDNIGKEPAGITGNILQVYYGSVRKTDGIRYFPIQYGACRRDSANVLGDKEHLPMLQDVIRMVMQVAKPNDLVFLTREDVKMNLKLEFENHRDPAYAYRMNRDKDGNDTFFNAVDFFAAPVDFWVKIFSDLPDVVMGIDAFWSRLLMEIFRKNGAVEILGIYRNEA